MAFGMMVEAAEAARLREEAQALRMLRQAACRELESWRGGGTGAINRIGTYLMARGQISSDQLEDALWEQRERRRRGDMVQLGEILVRRGALTVSALARALVAHHQERLGAPEYTPRLLGERLLAAGKISAAQLAGALEEQLRLTLAGDAPPLGTILVRRGAISPDVLSGYLTPAGAPADAAIIW